MNFDDDNPNKKQPALMTAFAVTGAGLFYSPSDTHISLVQVGVGFM